ncbi:hypothetical protein E5F05_12100 [Deinococcus metallilatus]|uniref:Alpha/beta hydrolase n=1 Tax=Deinococcus metallilatus TaxID=1211322 RepID=A0AAJ5F2K9_9DEIO|nr:hypothetical protein [Deinococcus metallilatus]MBB5295222.1 hypothetical protein [Deinococcus metallilatus]QBY08616.1 hypothetical protein E5F05_12100 [Deinococcus metallilatus]RXJ10495.1 hypothetical protein ERJ73_10930 [Deinococcus metallilatus]TLK26466.1 hypothetical protein FCS05_10680 [Deinococcus metallilatus]GMA14996.1 hypothetical protein GCM10025871_13270 [Deinococcus metallilatus]
MRAPLPAALLAVSLFLGACAPNLTRPPQPHTPALDFGGPVPDVVVFAVSGRCGTGCTAPRDNWDYLTARGTVDRVADTIAAAGYRVEAAGYASSASESFMSRRAQTPQRGYPALLSDYLRLQTAWPGAARPRVVLLGHSQGVAWLHHLARVTPEQPVALQIDLDGICAAWHSDHGDALSELPDDPARPSPAEACNLFRVAGHSLRGKDIVWPNVARNLEVQSKRLPARVSDSGGFLVNYLFEVTPNLRVDGSLQGIERYVSPREDHGAVSYPNSDALRWVAEQTALIVQDWKREDAARPH